MFNESIVEQAALDWLKGLGYDVLSGLAIAPGEPAAERSDYKQVFLFDRLQTKLEDLNPKIPLAVLELKNIADEQATIRKAFDQFQTYKAQIPSVFHSNALLVISDGHQAKLGTITSDWERFMTWRTVTGKELVPPGSLQLETLLKGVFDKHRLLDLIRELLEAGTAVGRSMSSCQTGRNRSAGNRARWDS
jgi:Type I restriction enzyme R protein N terminus (HSDR_N)